MLSIAEQAFLDGGRAASFQDPREKRVVNLLIRQGALKEEPSTFRGELFASITPAGLELLAKLRGEG